MSCFGDRTGRKTCRLAPGHSRSISNIGVHYTDLHRYTITCVLLSDNGELQVKYRDVSQRGRIEMDDQARKTMSVPEAGRHLGLGKNGAYVAAARGEIPVIKI